MWILIEETESATGGGVLLKKLFLKKFYKFAGKHLC